MNKLCLAGLAVAALVSSCGDDITTENDSSKEPTKVSTIAEANNALLSKDNVTIMYEISGKENTIIIPAATGSTSKTTKTVRMEKIADGANVNVKEAEGTNASTANNIVVSMPNSAASIDKAAQLDITTPNSTVTIKGNDGPTTLKQVLIHTAKHIIVTDGVTIGEVEPRVDKVGYVRINKGAKVKKIDADVSTIVYYEKGANIPSKDDEYINWYEIEVGATIPQ